jgi:hypothetical protein
VDKPIRIVIMDVRLLVHLQKVFVMLDDRLEDLITIDHI